jgi:hypothetical protein
MSLAQNWRRRDKFSEVSFIFPNAPIIPITVVCAVFSRYLSDVEQLEFMMMMMMMMMMMTIIILRARINTCCRTPVCECLVGMISQN